MRHKRLKIGIIAAAALTMTAIPEIQSEAAWSQDNQGWHYSDDSNGKYSVGWEKIQNSWYYFNENGVMQTGWVNLNGAWYFFNGLGAMQTGWFQENQAWYYSNSDGKWIEGYTENQPNQSGNGTSGTQHFTEYENKEYTIYLNSGNREVVTGYFAERMEEDAYNLLNAYRKEHGLNELKRSQVLDKSGEIRGYEIAHFFRHNRPNRTSVLDMEGVYGENIAYGYDTAEALMSAWIASPSHNENMLKVHYNTVCIKIFAKQESYSEGIYYTYYAVQLFGI